jgi:hypothetical protein
LFPALLTVLIFAEIDRLAVKHRGRLAGRLRRDCGLVAQFPDRTRSDCPVRKFHPHRLLCRPDATRRLLDRPNVRGARTFLPRSDGEFHQISFLQLVEGAGFHFGMMEEQVSLVARNETEAFVADDFLDFSLGHC